MKDLLKGLTDINIAIGKDLSEDGIDGLAGLMKVDGIDSARLANMAKWLKPPADVELVSALKAVKGIDELVVKPEGFEKVFGHLATANKSERLGKIEVRGSLHELRDVGSADFGGVSNISKFETPANIPSIDGSGKPLTRRVDVIRKQPETRLEYKAWETGEVTSWGAIHGNKNSAYEFVKDILYDGEPVDFGWVVRGTDKDKVQYKMLQTLGVKPVNGKYELHPVLQEALDNRRLTEKKINDIIDQVRDGSLIRIVR